MIVGNLRKSIIIFVFFYFFSFNLHSENTKGYAVSLGALDKITAKFSEFNINVGEKLKFGSLNIKVHACQKRPPEEIPENFILLEIFDEIDSKNPITVFSGWMLSSSPSLSTLEHPTYDIWAKDCKINETN